MVIVNSVVIVRDGYLGSASDVTIVMAAFGFGSMLAALILPPLLGQHRDRPVMVVGALVTVSILVLTGLLLTASLTMPWPVLLLVWFLLGLGHALVLTPSGRLLHHSAHDEDRPSVFTAQFALSHACWLIAYPLAGWAAHAFGMGATMLLLGAIALIGAAGAWLVWPADDPMWSSICMTICLLITLTFRMPCARAMPGAIAMFLSSTTSTAPGRHKDETTLAVGPP